LSLHAAAAALGSRGHRTISKKFREFFPQAPAQAAASMNGEPFNFEGCVSTMGIRLDAAAYSLVKKI
jgi:hypothetical protein